MEKLSPLSEPALKRAVFQSRRGMLELDLLLVPYAKERLPSLSPEDQHAYIELLSEEDTDLFTWLLQSQKPSSGVFQQVVKAILQHNDQRSCEGKSSPS